MPIRRITHDNGTLQVELLDDTGTAVPEVAAFLRHLAARDYSRLVECGKTHCLGLIEFRILKCGQPEQTVQHRRRQPILLDIQKV